MATVGLFMMPCYEMVEVRNRRWFGKFLVSHVTSAEQGQLCHRGLCHGSFFSICAAAFFGWHRRPSLYGVALF